MLSRVESCCLIGLEVLKVEVEVDIAGGLPAWEIVGLPDAAGKESKERVRAALKNSGYEFPSRRIVVNMAPADIRKEGPIYDLPIALALLSANEDLPAHALDEYVVLGELGLDGGLRRVNGTLSVSLKLKEEGKKLIVPAENAAEAAIGGAEVYAFSTLLEVMNFLTANEPAMPVAIPPWQMDHIKYETTEHDLAYVKGQKEARRALEITAAGGHNMLMVGPPGSGKTMLARCLPGIMPPLTLEESLHITQIYSIVGLLPTDRPLITKRPFRTPHHSASQASVVGGGRIPRPGEISLASGGVLFLDELPEFPRDVLESLRQPLEEKEVVVSRVSAQITYPAEFILLGAMNPCYCGNFPGSPKKECICTPHQVHKYRSKISGPLLDRIDIQIELQALEYVQLHSEAEEESSAVVRKRVMAARELQSSRYKDGKITTNAELKSRELKKHCKLGPAEKELLKEAFNRLSLSARAHDRLLRVARTIADLDGAENIESKHLAEAIQYRFLDRRASDMY